MACTKAPEWVKKHIPSSRVIITDTYNSSRLINDVAAYLEVNRLKFSAVGTFYEHVVSQTAELAAALRLIGINSGAARRSSSNKLLMRVNCRDAGIDTPRFKVINVYNKKELLSAIKKIGTPCVVKPVFGAESYGTVKVESLDKIDEIITEIKTNTTSDKKEIYKNFTGLCLVEEYLSGKVVSVDGLIQGNITIIVGMVEFVMGPEPRFTQEANYIPARVNKKEKKECVLMAKKVIKALGLNNCGFHCELRITPKGPVLLEIAARLPGGPLQLGYKEAMKVDLTSEMVDIWLGKKIKIDIKTYNNVLQKAVFPRNGGKILDIQGLEAAKKIIGVWDFSEIAKKGEDIVTYPDIPKPFYYYAIKAKTFKKLQTLSDQVERTVKIIEK